MNTEVQARRAFAVVAAFVAVCVAIVVYLFSGTQLTVPFIEQPRDYELSATITDIDNLVPAGQVRIAGIEVGEVRSVTPEPDGMRVVMAFNREVAPLHEGVRVRVGARSLVGETYLGIEDGGGPELVSGTALPADAVEPSVDVREIVYSIDAQTRTELSGTLQRLGASTEGTKQDVDALFTGFGNLGREGYTALDAVAAQSTALRSVVAETATLLNALDAGDGAIADLVTNSRQITDATAGERESIEAIVRKLPGVLDSAETATASLTELAEGLGPVAAGLAEAGPPLSDALRELPGVTTNLRGMLPAFERALNHAQPALDKIPGFGQDVRDVIPASREILRDINPMLEYLRPYGPELGGFVANFNAMLNYRDESGVHYARLLVQGNDSQQTVVDQGLATYRNPYPRPGEGANPGPFEGEYPKIERAPR